MEETHGNHVLIFISCVFRIFLKEQLSQKTVASWFFMTIHVAVLSKHVEFQDCFLDFQSDFSVGKHVMPTSGSLCDHPEASSLFAGEPLSFQL